jgi:SAM-dependent methyltransferase
MVPASDPHALGEPSPWIVRHAPLFAPRSRVLDLAAGRGRHARYLASLGHEVVAVDRDAEALATLAGIPHVTTRALDLEGDRWPLAGERYDGIVVANYLHRPTFGPMLDALADAGVLLYETFAAGNEAYGRPSNSAFLLESGELVERVRGRLAVVSYEEGRIEHRGHAAVIQRIAAVGVGYGRPWPIANAGA